MSSSNSFGGGGPLAVGLASGLLGLATILLALRAYTSIRLVGRTTSWDLLWISIAYVILSSNFAVVSTRLIRNSAIGNRSHCARLPRAVHSLRHWQPLDGGGSQTSRPGLSVRLVLQHLHHHVERVWKTCHPRHLAPYSRANQQDQALDPLFRGGLNHDPEHQSKRPCVVPVQAY